MKNINNFIFERLKLTAQSQILTPNPDELDGDNVYTLYDDVEIKKNNGNTSFLEDARCLAMDDCDEAFQYINKHSGKNHDIYGFVVFKDKSITQNKTDKEFERNMRYVHNDLFNITSKILYYFDDGASKEEYTIKLVSGHLEINITNKGTYYIYALSSKGYEQTEKWYNTPESLDPNETSEGLKFLLNADMVLPMYINA